MSASGKKCARGCNEEDAQLGRLSPHFSRSSLFSLLVDLSSPLLPKSQSSASSSSTTNPLSTERGTQLSNNLLYFDSFLRNFFSRDENFSLGTADSGFPQGKLTTALSCLKTGWIAALLIEGRWEKSGGALTFASLFLFEASVLVMLEQGCTLLYEETWFNLLCNGALISCSLLPEVLGSSLLCEDDKQIRMMLPLLWIPFGGMGGLFLLQLLPVLSVEEETFCK